MLSDKVSVKGRPSPVRRTGLIYPDSVKLDAVKLYLVTGNLRAVAAGMNIPYDTLKVWKASKWWSELAVDIRTEGTIALSNRMKRIAEKAMDITMDRMEHGDFFFDKEGQVVRKPVAMRDAHQVAVSFADRALKLEERPQNEAATQQVQDRLAALAEAFSKMANKTRKIDIIDVEDTSAISDQREEGLQEGTSLGTQEEPSTFEGSCEAGPSEAYGGEDDGEPSLDSAR